MVNLDIPNDKNFFDYLLQSLTDHHCLLSGYDQITVRLGFTKEFLASFWLQLMKIAELNYVPTIIIEDHERQGKINNGFDSINRSIFEVCESRIDLRLTTKFVFTGKELADEEQIQLRTAFMLVLLFVSEWVADQKEGCPHVTFKEPYSRFVYECFNKLFKEIYYGNNENFKTFIFDSNKENSPTSPIRLFTSPNHSIDNFDNSWLNITPYGKKYVPFNESLGRLSNTNDSLLKPVNFNAENEEKNVADTATLCDALNDRITELEKSNANLIDEKEKLQQNFLKIKNEFEEFKCLKEIENQNILNERQLLLDAVEQIREEHDLVKDQLSNAVVECDRLKKDNDELMNVMSDHAKIEKKLMEDNKVLEQALDSKILELENKDKLCGDVVEEKNNLEVDLSKIKLEFATTNNFGIKKEEEINNLLEETKSLNDALNKLHEEFDSCNEELTAVKHKLDSHREEKEALMKELNITFEDVEKLKKDKEALQQILDDKILEMEKMNKFYAEVGDEKRCLQQELVKTKQELEEANITIAEKEVENKKIFNEKQSLSGIISKFEMDQDLIKEELSNVVLENERLQEENENYQKIVNRKTRNEERLEEDNQALQKALDAEVLEFEKTKELLTSVQSESDSLREEKEAAIKELNIKFEDEEKLEKDKEALQQILDDKILELENMNKFCAEVGDEKRCLQQELVKTKQELEEANNTIVEKEVENKNIFNEKQSLSCIISKFEMDQDLIKEELTNVVLENENYQKIVNRKTTNEERLEEDNQALQKTLDAKVLELEKTKELLTSVQSESDSHREEKEALIKELYIKFEDVEKLEKDKEALQQILDDKILEMEKMNKFCAEVGDEKRYLQQELMKTKQELEEANITIAEKEVENKNIFNEKQSLSGIISKFEMDQDLIKEELSNVVLENERLQEENENYQKIVNRKTRNEERLEEDNQALQKALDAKGQKLEKTKELLSSVQSELIFTVNEIRGISIIKSEIEAEFDAFKLFFDDFTASLGNKWAIVKNLSDDLAAERLHNISISNQLEELRDEISVRERSRTPSLHDEGITGYVSRRTSFNIPPFDENMSELMSEPFDEDIRLDSGIGSNEQTPGTTPRDDTVSVEQPSFFRRNISSVSQWFLFFLIIVFLFTIHIYLCGAVIPPWIYLRVHHDQLPPQ